MAELLEPIDRRAVADHRWSVASLLATNLLPLAGVLLLGWRAFDVVFLYWMENVVIGVINVLKILTCNPSPDEFDAERALRMDGITDLLSAQVDEADRKLQAEQLRKFAEASPLLRHGAKFFIAPFFVVHYGLFCLVHGVFVCVLLSEGGPMAAAGPFDTAREALSRPGIWLTALGLGVSHLVSYFTNFLGRGEYRRTTAPLLMAQPYARVVVLHVAIVLSGFLTVSLGSPIWLLVLLIAGKTWLDLKLHLREHDDPSEGDSRQV